MYHLPVLYQESIDALVTTNPHGYYVDVTMGGAGHSKAILQRLAPEGHLFCFDRDPDAVANAPQDERCTFIASNFRHLAQWMRYYQVPPLSGVLADLGVSSHHFDTAARGFSFRFEGAMPDMRMNNRAGITARDILNDYTQEALADLFYQYGELKDARRIASLICRERTNQSYTTIEGLLGVIAPTLPPQPAVRRQKLSQIFQALRIEVNDEFGALRTLLFSLPDWVASGGRVVILTYHSLEDRLVKEWSRGNLVATPEPTSLEHTLDAVYGRTATPFEPVFRKPILPTPEEIEANPRARSAKMRVLQRR